MDDKQFIKKYNDRNGKISFVEFANIIGKSERKVRNWARDCDLPVWNRTTRQFKGEYTVPELPDEHLSVEELKAQHLASTDRKISASKERELIRTKIKLEGPIGLWITGDPHIGDNGCNYRRLLEEKKMCIDTPGMLGICVGDLSNNWIGGLGRLYAEQETSVTTEMLLVKDFIEDVPWLAIAQGNHDAWMGSGLRNPINWMAMQQNFLTQDWRVRQNLVFPNKREVRIHTAHDFPGNSMWNGAHGPNKAARLTWRDHLLVCGHKHNTSYQVITHGDGGITGCSMSHALRLAGFKVTDDYGNRLGHSTKYDEPGSAVAIINPDAKNDNGLIQIHFDMEAAVDQLNWMRKGK